MIPVILAIGLSLMSNIFPIDIHYVSAASQNDYAADAGCDIGVPRGTPVVAIGDAVLKYAEYGHVKSKWLTPGNDPYSVRIILKRPIKRNGKLYREVFHTHLKEIDPAIKNKSGIEVKMGQRLGWSGTANNSPHLHITFYEDGRSIGYIGDGANRKDDQKMMWDEWLPVQINSQPNDEGEEEMQSRPLAIFDTDTGFQILGADNAPAAGMRGRVQIQLRKKGPGASEINTHIYRPGQPPLLFNNEIVKDPHMRVLRIGYDNMPGPFAAQITHTGDAVWWIEAVQYLEKEN